MNVGVLYSRIRVEEKLLVQNLEARGIAYEMIDVRQKTFNLQEWEYWRQFDVFLERCVSHSRAQAAFAGGVERVVLGDARQTQPVTKALAGAGTVIA